MQKFCASAPRFLLVFFVLALAGCGEQPLFQQQAFVFGTRVEISIYGAEEIKARAASAAVLQEFDRLHHAFHAWKPSPVTELNAAFARGERHPISPELATAIRTATRYAEASDNLFNPAIGQLIALWGFQSDDIKATLPAPERVAALVQANPRMRDITLSPEGAFSRNRAVQLDFGGYAKGLALDRAVQILRAHGIRNALVNIGGNLIALGQHGARPWHVGVQHPRRPGAILELDLLDGEAIGTSGDYQRFFELGGTRYCHIIDPRSGYPAQHAQSLTVLAAPGVEAGLQSDIASKPAFILGARGWEAQLKRIGVEAAMFVDESGKMAMTKTLAKRARWVRQ